jgi:hypothetical protein
MVLGLAALKLALLGLPGTTVGLLVGAGGVGAFTLRRPLQRISIAVNSHHLASLFCHVSPKNGPILWRLH